MENSDVLYGIPRFGGSSERDETNVHDEKPRENIKQMLNTRREKPMLIARSRKRYGWSARRRPPSSSRTVPERRRRARTRTVAQQKVHELYYDEIRNKLINFCLPG
ncbi:hypothetical protein PUN28_019253 [Cardiocondyla obscurior]|uniref:Uncharacterized protein n=1 Tax=Cardiocondyla obscurior TaxID=286306 RepID=A0AAW2ECQ5_9HYME